MTLYRPPLLLKNQKNLSTIPSIEDALKGIEYSYFYSGSRLGKSNNIELDVCTVVIDSEENIFMSNCNYSGQKETWKEVIKEQLRKHLAEIGVEPGIVKSETRYFEVSADMHLSKQKYELKVLDFVFKINGKNSS